MNSSLRKWIYCALVVSACSGCASVATSNTARTAREQLLVSNSVDRALNKVSFTAMRGTNVYLEEKYLDSVDKNYVLGSVRHRILREGGRLVGKAEEADMIVEVCSGAVGTDTSESFIGLPEITLPGMLTLPEVRLWSRAAQQGYAKIGLVAYDAKSKQILGDGGLTTAQSNDNNTYVLGIGPFQSGSIRKEVESAKTRRPGTPHRPLPSMVAFSQPVGGSEGSEFEFASGEREIEE